uniref:Tetraspanin-6 n=1 Tax=Canis lupus dingo TaxID=286419 RepID=A0A8C0K4R1_CANLU
MLKLYAMFLTLIFLVELVAAIVGFVFRHEIRNSFKSNYERTLKQYNSTGDYRSDAVDKIQNTLHCCGVTDYRDWRDTNYYSEKGFPKSCCKLENCSPQRDADKVNNEGCFIKVMTIIESEMGVVAGISFGVAYKTKRMDILHFDLCNWFWKSNLNIFLKQQALHCLRK